MVITKRYNSVERFASMELTTTSTEAASASADARPAITTPSAAGSSAFFPSQINQRHQLQMPTTLALARRPSHENLLTAIGSSPTPSVQQQPRFPPTPTAFEVPGPLAPQSTPLGHTTPSSVSSQQRPQSILRNGGGQQQPQYHQTQGQQQFQQPVNPQLLLQAHSPGAVNGRQPSGPFGYGGTAQQWQQQGTPQNRQLPATQYIPQQQQQTFAYQQQQQQSPAGHQQRLLMRTGTVSSYPLSSATGARQNAPPAAEGDGGFLSVVANKIPAPVWLALSAIQIIAGLITLFIGALNTDRYICQIEPNIPIYLILSGILLILNGSMRIFFWLITSSASGSNKSATAKRGGDGGGGRRRPNASGGGGGYKQMSWYALEAILLFGIVVVLILGCVWVYGASRYMHSQMYMFERNYCSPTVYWAAWWSVTLHLVAFAVLTLISIVLLVYGALLVGR